VTREEFERWAGYVLQKYPEVIRLEWFVHRAREHLLLLYLHGDEPRMIEALASEAPATPEERLGAARYFASVAGVEEPEVSER